MSQIIRLHTNNLDCNQNQDNGISSFDLQRTLNNFCSATYSHQQIQHLLPTTLKSDLSQTAPLELIVRWTTFDTRHQTPDSIRMSYPFPRKYQRSPRIYSAMTESWFPEWWSVVDHRFGELAYGQPAACCQSSSTPICRYSDVCRSLTTHSVNHGGIAQNLHLLK